MNTKEETTKRGRPPIITKERREFFSALFPECRTERNRNNLYYRQLAIHIIHTSKSERECVWLFDYEKCMAGTGEWRPTLLAELGRIPDADELLIVARELCRVKPKTKDGIALIRNYRLGQREPDPLQLCNEIIHTVNDYWKRFPKITAEQVLSAIDTARGQIQ